MSKFNAHRIAVIGVVAAIYVVITIVGADLSYGPIQFRVAEAFMLLCFLSLKRFNDDIIHPFSGFVKGF